MKTKGICLLAFGVVMNFVGGQIALLLQLPIYLDALGTFLIAALMGPAYGMLPNLISGLIMGMTNDPYALYYAPVGMLLGLLSGLLWRNKEGKKQNFIVVAFLISVPTSLASACITAYLFGGITSSGSSVIVQLLSKTGLSLTISCFLVQLFSDFFDRWISLFLVSKLIERLPMTMRNWDKP